MARKPLYAFLLAAGIALAYVGPATADQPITVDSRIKTLVYNPNEVFPVTTHYGYQSNIEFGPKESIDMISVGDRVAWQISPAGRRLFIRAQEENAHTNMTVVTNLRAYQFDLRSSAADAVFGSEELTYVVRFFYPEEGGTMPVTTSVRPAASAQQPQAAAVPISTGTIPAPQQVSMAPLPAPTQIAVAQQPAPTIVTRPAPAPVPAPVYNYRYTYSGANNVAPVKIFDDGKSTYFKFNGAASPQVAIITAKGEVLDIPTRVTPEGLIAVNAVAPRFSIKQAGQQVVVYNEANGVL